MPVVKYLFGENGHEIGGEESSGQYAIEAPPTSCPYDSTDIHAWLDYVAAA